MNIVIAHFPAYDPRRFGTPWAAPCMANGRPDFKSDKCGRFTGGRGLAGDLYVTDPELYSVYVYGQRNYREAHSEKRYAHFIKGEFVPVSTSELLEALALWAANKNPTKEN